MAKKTPAITEDHLDFLAIQPPGDARDPLEELQRVRDPNMVGWPVMLPMELALKANTPKEICDAYGLTKEDLEFLTRNAAFVKAYADAVELLKIDGMTFKVKAKMAAEEFLKTSFQMVQNKNTSDSVRADLIKSTVRWAGLDTKAAEVGAGGASFAIQINLGT